jgi:hypothetical protein
VIEAIHRLVGAGTESEAFQVSPAVQTWIKLAAWLCLIAIAVVTVVPIGLRPATPYSAHSERFCVLAVAGCLFVLAYPGRFWTIVFALACAVVLLESLQFLVASRHPGFRDVLVKSAGTSTGAILGHLMAWIWVPDLARRSVKINRDRSS